MKSHSARQPGGVSHYTPPGSNTGGDLNKIAMRRSLGVEGLDSSHVASYIIELVGNALVNTHGSERRMQASDVSLRGES